MNELVDTVAGPWDRKLAALKYRKDLIGHETWGYRHPGEPPDGYREMFPEPG